MPADFCLSTAAAPNRSPGSWRTASVVLLGDICTAGRVADTLAVWAAAAAWPCWKADSMVGITAASVADRADSPSGTAACCCCCQGADAGGAVSPSGSFFTSGFASAAMTLAAGSKPGCCARGSGGRTNTAARAVSSGPAGCSGGCGCCAPTASACICDPSWTACLSARGGKLLCCSLPSLAALSDV